VDSSGRSWRQVAAEAEVSDERAMVACYLADLARAGKSMNEAASLLRKGRGEVRTYARDWGLRFTDYQTAPQPLQLIWKKPKRGLWTLEIEGGVIAEAIANGGLGYKARRIGHDWHVGSNAEIAMRRLSAEMERDSLDLFGVDDVVISMQIEGVGRGRLAPTEEPRAHRLQSALAVSQ